MHLDASYVVSILNSNGEQRPHFPLAITGNINNSRWGNSFGRLGLLLTCDDEGYRYLESHQTGDDARYWQLPVDSTRSDEESRANNGDPPGRVINYNGVLHHTPPHLRHKKKKDLTDRVAVIKFQCSIIHGNDLSDFQLKIIFFKSSFC